MSPVGPPRSSVEVEGHTSRPLVRAVEGVDAVEAVDDPLRWIEALGLLLLGIAGLWAAHAYGRARRLRLAEDRVAPYGKLWAAMAASSARRKSDRPLTPREAQAQLDRLREWYHGSHGGAMLLPIPTLKMLRLVMADLEKLSELGQPPDGECGRDCAAKARRLGDGVLAGMSLLRTQLKIDLDVYNVDEGPQLRRRAVKPVDEADLERDRNFLARACVDLEFWGRPRRWPWSDSFHWNHYDGRRFGTVTPLYEPCPDYVENREARKRQDGHRPASQ